MKSFITATLLLFFCISTHAQESNFDRGYKDGYKEGYCYQEYGCIPPIPPLKDGSGMVYYLTDKESLRKYFNSENKLKNLYLASEDFIVTRTFRNETVSFIKEDLVDLIQCSDMLYSEISAGMKNDNIINQIYGS